MDEPRFNGVKVVRWTDLIQGVLVGKNFGPIRANLDLTNLCQDRCSWCEPLAYRKETIADRRHTLDFNIASTVLTDLGALGCRMVHFSGGGEPLLHKGFGKLLQQAKRLGMRTFVITNGGRMEAWTADLCVWADHIRVSLDASNQEEHTAIHGSVDGTFERIYRSLKFIANTPRSERPEVGLGYVLTDENSSEDSLVRAMRIADSVPVDFIQFRPVSELEPHHFTYAHAPGSDWEGLASWIARAAKDCCPDVKVWTTGARASDVFRQREFERCYSALTVAVIGADGRVSACCDERGIVFGNVNEQRFREIWLSVRHREEAAKIVPKLCERCLQCGFNKAVEDYVVKNWALVEFV